MTTTRRVGITVSLCFLLTMTRFGFLSAQSKRVSTSHQQWLHYYLNTQLNDKWTWRSDGVYRWKSGFQERAQYLVRTGLGYTLNSRMQIATGISYAGSYKNGEVHKTEFRPYQELVIKNRFRNIGMRHRYRIEERFFQPMADANAQLPNRFNFRFRYALMASIPLFKLSKINPVQRMYLNMGNEIFIHTGREIIHNVFDRNRIIISPTVQVSPSLTISCTWNSQFASAFTPATYTYTNVVWFQIRQKINWARREKES